MKLHKILEARATNGCIYLKFSDGVEGEFRFSDFFDFVGVLSPLKDSVFFENIQIENNGHHVFWSADIDLDTEVLYSIISNRPIIVDNRVVFDPSRGKNAWL